MNVSGAVGARRHCCQLCSCWSQKNLCVHPNRSKQTHPCTGIKRWVWSLLTDLPGLLRVSGPVLCEALRRKDLKAEDKVVSDCWVQVEN